MNISDKILTPKNQKEEVLHHLQTKGTITSMDAIKNYNITRLAAIIHRLRDEGWTIVSKNKKFISKYGRKSTFSEYSFAKNK